MKYFSTFSGIGGFELGIQAVDQTAEFVGYSEIDKYATKVYERHFPNHENYGDITKINAEELPDFDCLVGGFPCQAFSIAGKRKGFDDTRGTLFFDLARILRAKRPMYGVFENVKGLVNHDGGKTFDVILETLQELGYYVNWEIYNSKDHGVPQNRERVILVCQHATGLTNIGQNQKIGSYERLIQSYLFQLLLNNLVEVKKLQETASKDWVLGYLIWKEISEKHQSQDTSENTTAGTTTVMDANISQLPAEALWQNIATWLSNEWGVDLSGLNMSTISTVIKRITPSKTYTFLQMQALIWLATVVLRKSQKSLWNEVLSSLTLIQEGTKYARINRKEKEIIVSESGTVHLSDIEQDQDEAFVKLHLRGTSRPEIFPITATDEKDTRVVGQDVAYTIDANYHKGTNTLEKSRRSIVQVNNPIHSNDRVYGADGISPTLNTMQGGNRQPKITIPVLTPDRSEKRQNGRRFKTDGEPQFTLNTQDRHGINDGAKIRRLTPVECERLQAFPDNWTKYAVDGTEVSDTQRYKMCGNAVTTNVIQDVFERVFEVI